MEIMSYRHLVPPSYIIDRVGSRDGVSYRILSDVYVSSKHLDVMRLTVAAVFDPVSVEGRFIHRYGSYALDDDGEEIFPLEIGHGLPLWLRDLYFSVYRLLTRAAVLFIFDDDGILINLRIRETHQYVYRQLAVLT